MKIEYTLSQTYENIEAFYNYANANEILLRYELFTGNLIFYIDDCDLSMPWDWVPIFDFAICFYEVLKELKSGKIKSIIDFTESDEKLFFEKKQNNVEISSSYSQCKGIVSYNDFFFDGFDFIEKVLTSLSEQFIGLSGNPFFKKFQNDFSTLYIN